MSVLNLKWDGSDLGDITKHIISYENERTDIIGSINIKEKIIKFRIYQYENDIPLIVDELKKVFGITKNGRHKAIIAGQNVILCRSFLVDKDSRYKSGEINLLEVKETLGKHFFKEHLVKDIKKCFVFRLILGLTKTTEESVSITFRPTGLLTAGTCRETKIITPYEDKKTDQARIYKSVMKEWFNNSYDEVNKILSEMIDERSVNQLRIEMIDIARKFDKELIWWPGLIARRIQEHI